MSHKPIVTNRVLSNKVTGIDIFVPDHVETPGKLQNTAVYNVIVITKLFYYKTKQHKESDLVQFMIPKQYEEFEDLYHKLSARFPSVNFPSLPRKSLLTSSSVFNDRCRVMDSVLRMVARMQKLCCSPMVLQFLGATKPKSNRSISKPKEKFEPEEIITDAIKPEDETQANIEDCSETQLEEVDLFMQSTPSQEHQNQSETNTLKSIATDTPDGDLFSVADNTDSSHQLFVSRDLTKTPYNTPVSGMADHSNLLDMNDGFDDLMALSRKSKQRSSVKSDQSTKSRSASSRSISDSANDEMFSRGRTSSHKKEDRHPGNDSLDDIFKTRSQRTSFLSNENDDDEDDDALFNQRKTLQRQKQPDEAMTLPDIANKLDISSLDSADHKIGKSKKEAETQMSAEDVEKTVTNCQDEPVKSTAEDDISALQILESTVNRRDDIEAFVEHHNEKTVSVDVISVAQNDIETIGSQLDTESDAMAHDIEARESDIKIAIDMETIGEVGVADSNADNANLECVSFESKEDKGENVGCDAHVSEMDSDEILAYISKEKSGVDQMEDLEL